MGTIFPLRETVRLEDRTPRLVEFDDDAAEEVFGALAAETTREVFAALHEEPRTISDLASATGTSVQNAQYHVEKLLEADLIEAVDTWYSERGTEMDVYAPTDRSLVLFADGQDRSLRAALRRVLGALAVLLPASALLAWLVRAVGHSPAGGGAGIATEGGPAGRPAPGALEAVVSDPAMLAGVAFLLGGAFALAFRYWRR